MAWASNWLRVRSICAEVNFIARSNRGFAPRHHELQVLLR
jgi:hypothetical protein